MKHDHPTEATDPLATYTPVTLRARHDGWTAERQRTFLAALAETGCISEAAHAAKIAPRSPYGLRNHPQEHAFARAWDQALQLASVRRITTAMNARSGAICARCEAANASPPRSGRRATRRALRRDLRDVSVGRTRVGCRPR